MSQGPATRPFIVVMSFLVASQLVAVYRNCFYSDWQLATLCNFIRHFHVFLKWRRSYIASHRRSLLHTRSQDSKKPYKTPELHACTDDSSRVKNMFPEMVQILLLRLHQNQSQSAENTKSMPPDTPTLSLPRVRFHLISTPKILFLERTLLQRWHRPGLFFRICDKRQEAVHSGSCLIWKYAENLIRQRVTEHTCWSDYNSC